MQPYEEAKLGEGCEKDRVSGVVLLRPGRGGPVATYRLVCTISQETVLNPNGMGWAADSSVPIVTAGVMTSRSSRLEISMPKHFDGGIS